jgi:hypothetical protein
VRLPNGKTKKTKIALSNHFCISPPIPTRTRSLSASHTLLIPVYRQLSFLPRTPPYAMQKASVRMYAAWRTRYYCSIRHISHFRSLHRLLATQSLDPGPRFPR